MTSLRRSHREIVKPHTMYDTAISEAGPRQHLTSDECDSDESNLDNDSLSHTASDKKKDEEDESR
jgi:hypothetical protein